MSKRHKNTRLLRDLGYSNIDICKIREITRKESEKAVSDVVDNSITEAHERAFLYMLAIPLNVFVAMWGEEEAKKKAPEFVEEVCSLYESVQDGYVTDEQLAEYLEEMAGLKITADWLRRKKND